LQMIASSSPWWHCLKEWRKGGYSSKSIHDDLSPWNGFSLVLCMMKSCSSLSYVLFNALDLAFPCLHACVFSGLEHVLSWGCWDNNILACEFVLWVQKLWNIVEILSVSIHLLLTCIFSFWKDHVFIVWQFHTKSISITIPCGSQTSTLVLNLNSNEMNTCWKIGIHFISNKWNELMGAKRPLIDFVEWNGNHVSIMFCVLTHELCALCFYGGQVSFHGCSSIGIFYRAHDRIPLNGDRHQGWEVKFQADHIKKIICMRLPLHFVIIDMWSVF
jgi:hypothetical protein